MLLASIIVNNYNYGRFLSQAIDSALRQTYPAVEVIVVDDGSTDDSLSVISGYGKAITPILKKNGGQASAFNAGFAAANGKIIIFLDADDCLAPDVVEKVEAAFHAQPQAAKVQYRLEVIDASGRPSGAVKPPWGRPLPSGDLRSQVLAFPDDIPWQPTSGNAFAARILRQIFPVPEDVYRICADYYLSNLPPLFGPVVALDDIGGCYRIHQTNNHQSSTFDPEQSRQIIRRTWHTHRHIKSAADSLGLNAFPDDPADVYSASFLAHRLVSMRLDPRRHPLPEDNPLPVFLRGLRAVQKRFDLSPTARLVYMFWFFGAFISPKPGVRWLAQALFYPGKRSYLTRRFGGV